MRYTTASKFILEPHLPSGKNQIEVLLSSKVKCNPFLFKDFLLSLTFSSLSLASSSLTFFTIRTRGTLSELIDSLAMATSICIASLAALVLLFEIGVGGGGVEHLWMDASCVAPKSRRAVCCDILLYVSSVLFQDPDNGVKCTGHRYEHPLALLVSLAKMERSLDPHSTSWGISLFPP